MVRHVAFACGAALLCASVSGCGNPPETAAQQEASIDAIASAAAPGAPVDDFCHAHRALSFAGQTDTPALRKKIRQIVGARTVRWVRPGNAVTHDLDPARLNVLFDESGKVMTARCG